MDKFTHDSSDAKVTYSVKVTVCADGTFKAREYKKPLVKKRNGFESVEESKKKKLDLHSEQQKPPKIEQRNLTRARDRLIALACENERKWLSFVTLTFKDKITDLTEANKQFHNWVRQWQRKKPDFAYLAVPEFQKNGRVHYHLLTNLKCGSDIPERPALLTWNPEHRRKYKFCFYDVPYWSHGYSTAEDLTDVDSSFNCALYITKYLFKDADIRLFGRNKVMHSCNLDEPSTYYLQTDTFRGALEYIKQKGYDISAYEFQPSAPYQIPHVGYSVPSRLHPEDRDIVECICSNSYSE